MFQFHGEGGLSGRAPSQGRSGIMLPDARCKEGGAERTEPIHSVHRFRPKWICASARFRMSAYQRGRHRSSLKSKVERSKKRRKARAGRACCTATRAPVCALETFQVVLKGPPPDFSGAKRLKPNAQSRIDRAPVWITPAAASRHSGMYSLKSPNSRTGPFLGAPLDSDSLTNSLIAWRISKLDCARACTPRSS